MSTIKSLVWLMAKCVVASVVVVLVFKFHVEAPDWFVKTLMIAVGMWIGVKHETP